MLDYSTDAYMSLILAELNNINDKIHQILNLMEIWLVVQLVGS